MRKTTLIDFEEIGKVSFKSDKRYKRLSIRIKPLEGVLVLLPPGVPLKQAINYVHEKKSWIQESLIKISEYEKRYTIFDENTVFKTRSFTLKIAKASRDDVRLKLYKGILNVEYPSSMSVTNTNIQEVIRYGIEEALRIEAKTILPPRLEFFANKFGLSYNKIFIKNLKSRWGSCSNINNINLNLQLMRLPDHLIDYVILHELCHTKEKNHGPGFWHLLNKLTAGRAKMLDSELKDYSTHIY